VLCSISLWCQATVASYYLLEGDAIEEFHTESSCNAERILANVSMRLFVSSPRLNLSKH
jgi:hypothetical protein